MEHTTQCRFLEELSSRIPAKSSLIVAVSGGIDSIALLDGLVYLQSGLSIQITVVHVDHALRESSHFDAEFVAQCAANYGVEFRNTRLAPYDGGDGIEAWARRKRYSFFNEVLEQAGADYIVTAHHADDRAETVLMRFLANREPSSIHAVDERRKLLRPLLQLRRSAIEEYVEHRKLAYREDLSNGDQSILRNRYRHTILPFLAEQLGTDPALILSTRAESLEDDAEALEQSARREIEHLSVHAFGSKTWFRELQGRLDLLPRAVAWRLVERILASQYQAFLGRKVSLMVLEFIINSDSPRIQIVGGRFIERRAGGLAFV